MLLYFIINQGESWGSETMGTSGVGTTTTTQPPVPTPGGFLAAGEQDWNVDTTSGTKDWAEDNGGEWGGDAQVTRMTYIIKLLHYLVLF